MTRLAPLWQQNSSYSAYVDRSLPSVLWPAAASTGHAVTTVTNTMNVSVAVGSTAVPLSGTNGTELCRSDAAEVVTLQTAPAGGQSRYDLICVQVRDAAVDAGSNNDWIVAVVTGVAAATPAEPAAPTNAVVLARVLVPGGVVNLNTATLVDRRNLLLVPAAGTAVPTFATVAARDAAWPNPPNGAMAITLDTGTQWQRFTGLWYTPLARLPNGFATRTADFSTTNALIPGMSITITVPGGRRIKVEAGFNGANSAAINQSSYVQIKEAGAVIGQLQVATNANYQANGGMFSVSLIPSSGAHTYELWALGSGANAINIQAQTTTPAYLSATDMGGL